jgi:hypothetical protein
MGFYGTLKIISKPHNALNALFMHRMISLPDKISQ